MKYILTGRIKNPASENPTACISVSRNNSSKSELFQKFDKGIFEHALITIDENDEKDTYITKVTMHVLDIIPDEKTIKMTVGYTSLTLKEGEEVVYTI